MLSEFLLYLSLVPIGSVFATSLARSNVLNSHGQIPIIQPHHLHTPDVTNGTIYKFLENNPKFTLITKALKFEEKILTVLNDSSAKLTFFAPPDEALRRPKHGGHPRKLEWDTIDALSDDDPLSLLENADFGLALDLLENLESPLPNYPERRKKILKFILHAILSYHIIPSDYDLVKLGLNNTFPTKLVFPDIFDDQPLRLKVDQSIIPHVTTINLYARIIQPSIFATNGFIHAINHPLLPPPSIFQELYMVPSHFSTFTSALQRSGLTDLLDLRYRRKEGLEGALLATVFAPTNHAFERLPKRLRLFLFSPFGVRVLKKLLQYHIVPESAFFSDYVHHRKAHDESECMDEELQGETLVPKEANHPWYRFGFTRPARKGPIVEPISHREYTLETALLGHTLDVVVDQKKITLPIPCHQKPFVIDTKIFVDRQSVSVRDVVGLNGGIHVINQLLDPRKHHRHEGDYKEDAWNDWEEWLPQWGEA